jgi:topoisomerase-4 subunit B
VRFRAGEAWWLDREVEAGEILSSQEVHDITVAIGVDPASDEVAGLRYDKICILADAVRGLHIDAALRAA